MSGSVSSTIRRLVFAAAIALLVVGAIRIGWAQAQQPAADALKFTTNAPVVMGWQIHADKTKEFEDFWAGLRAMLAKSDNDELKGFNETLSKIYRVNQPPFDLQGQQTVTYVIQLDSPSTTHSYNPVAVLYTDTTGLRAGLEGSKVTRAEADALYEKLKAAVITINPVWQLVKIG